ncbi:MAG: outer membrane protein assembly factor BamE [bacterium]|nr:outer membrane protein assembly factor BamE [bacterium]
MRIRKQIASACFLLTLAATIIGLAGCVTIGREFPVEAVSKIQKGKTTRAEIDLLFGTPWRTGIDDGMKTWTYAHYRYSLLGSPKTRDLIVRFNDQGVVVSYTFNSTYAEDATTIGARP